MNYIDELIAKRSATAQPVTKDSDASSIKKSVRKSSYGDGTRAYEFTLRTRIGDYTYVVQRDINRPKEWELRRVEFEDPFRMRLIIDEMDSVESCVGAAIRNATW